MCTYGFQKNLCENEDGQKIKKQNVILLTINFRRTTFQEWWNPPWGPWLQKTRAAEATLARSGQFFIIFII